MTGWFGKAATAVAGMAAITFGSPANANGMSIRAFGAQEGRLATIAYRMAAANAPICTRKQMMSGLVLHDLTQYDPSVRAAVSGAFSLGGGFGVLRVVPGSVADEAGIRVDDEILQINNVDVVFGGALDSAPKSYGRMDQFSALLEAALIDGPTELAIRRQGKLLRVQVRGQPGCGGDLALADYSDLNAWSDGAHVVVTTAMAAMASSDDEIAFVIAHEMAHNILGHSNPGGSAKGIFGGISQNRREELEADGFAVGLMSHAGYHPEGGIAFLEKVSRRLWWAISFDHPSFGRRIQVVTAAIAALPKAAAVSHPRMASDEVETQESAVAVAMPLSPLVQSLPAMNPGTGRSYGLRTRLASVATFRGSRTACEY